MKKIALVVSVLFLFAALAYAAGPPAVINYQGNMVDKGGAPLNATKNITFSIYSTTSGIGPVWSEQQSVTVTNGLFSTSFGSNQAKPLNLDKFPANGWLGIKVETDIEMRPLQQLTSVPYAINAYNGVPPGAIMAYGGVNPPPGWLLCDGRSLKRSDYPGLYASIGAAHGYVDTTTFNLPDYRGRFLRGVDERTNGNNDPDKSSRTAMSNNGNTGVTSNSIGSVQGDAIMSHKHSITDKEHSHRVLDNVVWQQYAWGNYGVWAAWGNPLDTKPSFTGITETNIFNGSIETRPKNAYVNWIIKF